MSFNCWPQSRALYCLPVCSVMQLLVSAGYRGRFRSKPWAAVLEEARKLVDSGAVELNLIAEDTNQ